MKVRRANLFVVVVSLAAVATVATAEDVRGVVINHIPASSQIYIGSPGIAVLPNGNYIAKHDQFGPRSTEHGRAVTEVFGSADRGASWSHRAVVQDMYWASVFSHDGALYLLGTSKNHGDVVIRRSTDGGRTWTQARDKLSGVLIDGGEYHCAPVPVVLHRGRLWRAMEDAMGPGGWGRHFNAFMMSAPADADLLNAENWVVSNRIGRDPAWLDNTFGGWLEGNAVVTPDGRIVNILRVDTKPEGGKAAIIEVSEDGKTATFDPQTGFIDFPGGAKKFTIRFDPVSKLYWTLSNPILPRHKDPNPGRVRNALALMCSKNLWSWSIRCILLYHPDVDKHGFQYVDWLFEGDDIIAASRTAYGQGADAAHNQHDANYLTFHRFQAFRDLTMAASAPGAQPGEAAWQSPDTNG